MASRLVNHTQMPGQPLGGTTGSTVQFRPVDGARTEGAVDASALRARTLAPTSSSLLGTPALVEIGQVSRRCARRPADRRRGAPAPAPPSRSWTTEYAATVAVPSCAATTGTRRRRRHGRGGASRARRFGRVHAEDVLGHVHADAAHQPERARVGAQPLDHRRDRVGEVAARRTAVIRAARRSPSGRARRWARCRARRPRSAASSGSRSRGRGARRRRRPRPRTRSASALAAAIAGERAEVGMLGDEHRVGRVAPAAQVDAPVGRDAERVGALVGRDDQRAPPCRRP